MKGSDYFLGLFSVRSSSFLHRNIRSTTFFSPFLPKTLTYKRFIFHVWVTPFIFHEKKKKSIYYYIFVISNIHIVIVLALDRIIPPAVIIASSYDSSLASFSSPIRAFFCSLVNIFIQFFLKCIMHTHTISLSVTHLFFSFFLHTYYVQPLSCLIQYIASNRACYRFIALLLFFISGSLFGLSPLSLAHARVVVFQKAIFPQNTVSASFFLSSAFIIFSLFFLVHSVFVVHTYNIHNSLVLLTITITILWPRCKFFSSGSFFFGFEWIQC
jgi:hypothetical protein